MAGIKGNISVTLYSEMFQLLLIYKDTHVSPARRASLGAITPEKLNCFSGGGAPDDPRITTESPERT